MIRKSIAAISAEVLAYAEQHSTSYMVAARELAEDASGAAETDAVVHAIEAQYRRSARRLIESAMSAGAPLYGADAAEARLMVL